MTVNNYVIELELEGVANEVQSMCSDPHNTHPGVFIYVRS